LVRDLLQDWLLIVSRGGNENFLIDFGYGG
jgi:hypothetical protein